MKATAASGVLPGIAEEDKDMHPIQGRAIVAQSGGPTTAINASAHGVIQTALAHPEVFTGVYGALNGILGVLREELYDIAREDPAAIDGLMRTPSSALGSCRYKLKDLQTDRADYERILEVFRAHDIRYFFYIGGNDSMDTADKLAQLAAQVDYEMVAIGVPKTIDNDLAYTDHCPGYGSVAKFNATAVMEAGRDTEAMYTADTVTIHEVMGRNAGWIAAATSLARREPADAPHLVYLPEVVLDPDRFAADVQACIDRHGGCFIVCGEGIRDQAGNYLAEAGGAFATDSFGHAQLGGAANALRALVEGRLGVKARTNRAGTAQRNAMHFASATDVAEAAMAGRAAVEAALAGERGKMVALVREDAAGPYRCTTGLVDLGKVANGEKPVPPEFINDAGNGLTEAFRAYASPLVQGQAEIEIGRDGLPVYTRLKKHRVAKKTARQYPV